MNRHCISVIPPSRKFYRLKKQAGSSLIIAIFIIIVISLLGASLISLQRDSAEGTSYEVFAARAHLAAYSASEVALVKLFPLGTTDASAATCTTVAQTVTLPDTIGFNGCSAQYTCEIISADVTRYKVLSTAVCKNSEINTRRQITVEATSL